MPQSIARSFSVFHLGAVSILGQDNSALDLSVARFIPGNDLLANSCLPDSALLDSESSAHSVVFHTVNIH